CQLLNYQCPFKAFSRTLIDRYDYEQQNNGVILQPIQLAKLSECHWILYQIVLFEFMLGKTQTVSLPVSLDRSEINRYFENYSGWWYYLFTTFWSRHNSIANIKCDPLNCSRCIIVDGHQKSRCPYGPCRKKQSSDTVNRTFCRYHQPSIHVLHSSHVTKACEVAVEFSANRFCWLIG
ncbi:unnamed protein product, partial [Rotaria magnacalcarata]